MLTRLRSLFLPARGAHARRRTLRAPASVAAGIVLALIGAVAVGAPAANADDLGSGVLNLSKTANVTEVTPGQSFLYTLNYGCSSTTTGCVNAVLTDPVPAPLQIVGKPTVVGAGSATTTVSGNTVTVAFADSVPNTVPASTGLAAGTTGSVQIQVTMPQNVDKSLDGTQLTNNATFTATNASTVSGSVPVTVHVPDVITASVSKTWTPGSTQYNPGETSQVALTVANTSNIPATSLTIAEPADPSAAGNTFDFYDLAGFGAVTFPAGADQVQVIALTAGGPVDGPVGATPQLSSGVQPGDVTGLRFVFSSSTGDTIEAGGTAGSVALSLVQRATGRTGGASLVAGGTRTNQVGATVSTPSGDGQAPLASAQQIVAPLTVSVSADKSFVDPQIPAGDSSVATVTAKNTSTGPLTSLTVTEPGSGTFFTNKVTFGGFTSAAAWPQGATGATIHWFVNSGTAPADSTVDQASGLPGAPTLSGGQYLTGFQIVYTGSIAPGATASIPFTVNTTTDAGPAGSGFVTYPNTATVEGANPAGTATDTANANLDVYFPEVKLTLDKTITPSTVIPGGTSLVQLSAQTPTGTSSVRPDTIVITEPQDTASVPYWNAFDATAIAPTSVPSGSKLTIEYTTDGTTWNTLAVVDATAAAKTYSATLDSVLPNGTTHSDVRGLRFTFTDADGFGQATNVKPAITFTARGELRDGSGPTNPGAYPTVTPYQNCAVSQASGTVAGSGITSQPAVDCDTVGVQATQGGPGPLLAAKSWDGTKVVQAQSGATTGVTLGWGSQVSGMQSMTIQDPAVPSPIGGSVFQAFDLVRIDAITPTSTAGATLDPQIRWDKVSKVELFDGTQWNDITSAACPTSNACDGVFPGYTLTASQRASTQGVRLTVIESPNRAARIQSTGDPTAPAVGSGVASVSASAQPNGRTVHLDLAIRNTVRGGTATDWVTGTRTYNLGGSPGAVDNTVRVGAQPFDGDPVSRDANDHVTIIDPTFTTKVTKTASPQTLVIPQPDVPASAYPSTTYATTATNTSTSKTWQLRLSDPTECVNATTSDPCVFAPYDAAANPFEQLNLTKIVVDLSQAPGVQTSASSVSLLHLAADGSTTTQTVTLAQAMALTPADLSDVVAVSALLRGTNAQGTDGTGGTIAPQQKVGLTLTAQLRKTTRTGGTAPVPSTILNNAHATLHDDVYPAVQAADEQGVMVTLQNGNLQVTTGKTFNPTSTLQANPVDPIQVNLRARSTGTLSPKVLVIEDADDSFWNAFTLKSFTLPNTPTGADRVQVDARTGQGANAQWQSGTPTAIGSAALPAGVAVADVTGLRYTYTRADGAAFSASEDKDDVRLNVSLRTTLRDGSGPVTSTVVAQPMPGETAAGTISDTVTADASYNDVHATQANASATFTVDPGTAKLQVEKTSPGQAASGREVNWTLRFKNSGTGSLANPVVTDTLPADGSLLYVPTNVPTFSTSTGGTLPVDGAVITRTYDAATGTIRFTWPAGSQLAPGETYSITIGLQIKPGLAPAKTAVNTFGVSTDRQLTGANCTALNPGNGRAVTFAGNTCSTSNVVTTLSQGSFTASKGVKSSTGQAQNVVNPALPCTADADGYYRYPCAAVSAIGATDDWKLEMVNGGNVAAKTLTAVDVFPYPGDTGVVDSSPRGSVYSPKFLGDLTFQPTGDAAGAVMTWYVTTAAKPCAADITPGSSCPAGAWVPSSEIGSTVQAADVTGVKMVFDFSGTASGTLAAGAAVKVTYTSTNVPTTAAGDHRAPVSAPVTAVRAWNSFGFYPTYVSGSQPAGPQEPIKAGVILTGGPLQITKTVTGPAAQYAPTSFQADVSCTIGGVAVGLAANATVTLSAANQYTARIDGIPTGAQCAVVEHGADGSYGEASRTVTPGSVTIAAADASAPVPDDQKVSIVNDYGTTDLTVTKHVDTAATAGAFGPFGVSVVCTAPLGQSIPLAAGDAAFTLQDGGSHTISGLPARSSCVVTETDADGAAASPNHVAISVDGAAATDGTQATVVLGTGPQATTADITNHYAAGALAIAKIVDGDAAAGYGDGPFTVHVTCVYAGDQTLFDGDLSIVGGQTLTVPGVYPAGTECSVVETTDGGATGSTVDTPTVTIPGATDGSVPTVTVSVTNTFSAGSVTIVKQRVGDGVARYGAGPFTAQLVCTWQKDGQTLTIPLPNAGLVTLDDANGYTATVTGLIQRAHCDVTETATGGATAVSIAPTSGVTVPAGAPAEVTITNTFDTGSLVIDKKRIGDGVASFGAGPFTMQVTCTYEADGVVTPIDLGTDGTVVLSKANGYSATIDGLIAGASCAIEETDAGLATATTMDPADGTVTISAGAAATVTVTNRFDVGHLRIAKTADRSTAGVGDTIVYTITVTNDGQIDAKDVAVTDHLPSGIQVLGAQPAAAKATDGELHWVIPGIAAGEKATITLAAKLMAPQDTTNRASVETPNGPWDPSTGDERCGDGATACATVTDPPVHGLANTGSDLLGSLAWAMTALAALIAGAGLLLLRRRPRLRKR
ncbi:conserved repeat domain-containing protein [Leifsonia sp. 98AMF]|uniref:DUF5979 domain-containing protein n=1 Tax=unclassified Leifsonia TaxID=2663824 RepID=UPI000879B927|nr:MULTISPECIES: DUF5979 domain-containing protein [unclassified Leifsonia]SDH71395.1 conserved repeat domain-containing protein [Leifsonia sp. 197AMF]SDJ50678.1 conserved repeat domain-containing protein [Leifsonia sp. 466MF]SDK23574.1 conserved repeat domain-containing protein [Leifsonia sp. 157MF]SDN70616.1 conserved repeat domain-containing protein [Leifsonia sp. 509MF]SEN37668.1 conserved repeat domain-containing protein [Leifsonia sp. 467MF]